jgi:TolB protein
MITGDPAQFYPPQGEPAPAFDALASSFPINPPDWSRIAFQTYRNGQWDIYLANPDGSNEVRLTNDTSSEVYPSLARGGSRVAFASNRNGNYDIFGVNADGSGLIPLTDSPASDTYPVWSPDAGRIAFQSNRSGKYEVYVMNADGSNQTQLTSSGTYDGEPTWSPDGSQIAFVSNRSGRSEIWVMNADGSNLRQLTSYSTTATPAWSPRGDKIAYANDRNMDGYYELWWMDADGANPATAIRYIGYISGDDWAPSWSPDGAFLSFIHTVWLTYGWTGSYINNYAPYYPQYDPSSILGDYRVMRVNWATTDLTPPGPCTITLAPYQNSDSFLLNWSATDSESGVTFYDVQSRRLPGGAWQDFLSGTNQSGGAFSGVHGDQFEFRCRARDLSWNLGDWSAAPFAATEIRTLRPTSTVAISSPRYLKGNQTIDVRWAGKGIPGLELRYDVFVRDGIEGDWTPWLTEVSTNSAQFNGTAGHTYYFRSQAHDSENRTQVWQPDSQGVVTFYPASLTVRTTDPRGNPLGLPGVSLNPAAFVDETGRNFCEKRLGVNAGPLNISATQPGFGAIPVTLLNISQDRSVTFVMPPSDNVVSNGGFETGALKDWSLSGDGVSLSSSEFHSGQFSAKITPGSGTSSQFSQVVTIAAAIQKPTLSFLYHFPENTGGGRLTVEAEGSTLQPVLSTTTVTSSWTHLWADLSAFSGKTVTLRFRLAGSNATAYIDEIALGSWTNPALESVTPGQWQANQPQTLMINGQNFTGIPQVFLNDIRLNQVKLLSASQLSVVTPGGMQGGSYTLRVIAANGVEAILPTQLVLPPLPTYIPLVNNGLEKTIPITVPEPIPASDWPTVGKDNQHSGFVAGNADASRYGLAWSAYPLTNYNPILTTQAVSAEGVVLVVIQPEGYGPSLLAYDANNGMLLWKYELNLYNYVNFSPPTIANGKVYFVMPSQNTMGGGVFCRDLYTGNIFWRTWNENFVTQGNSQAFGQNLYAYALDGLALYNVANGQKKGVVKLSTLNDLGSPTYADGKIYTWINGIFSEYTSDSGKILWSLAPAWNQASSYSAPVIVNRTAIVATTATLHAIDLDAHRVRWIAKGIVPAVAGDLVYAINDGVLEARQISSGALVASFTAPAALINNLIVSESHVYVSSATHTYLLDRATLQIKWTTAEGGWLTLANGYLIIVRSDSKISAYRAQER